jgi:hypothetical protein
MIMKNSASECPVRRAIENNVTPHLTTRSSGRANERAGYHLRLVRAA